MRIRVHMLTIIVCSSYLTLGIFDPSEAEQYWWEYALVTGLLALWGIHLDRKKEAINDD
jgi:hypothetical protein